VCLKCLDITRPVGLGPTNKCVFVVYLIWMGQCTRTTVKRNDCIARSKQTSIRVNAVMPKMASVHIPDIKCYHFKVESLSL
jgi:hypothetical protein